MHGVYKYEYMGEIIYVGKTDRSFSDRIYCHSTDALFEPYLEKAEIYVCELNSETESDFLETVLINQYKPIINKAKKNVTNFSVSAILEWTPWLEYNNSVGKNKKKPDGKSYSFYLSKEAKTKLEKLAKQKNCSESKALDALLCSIL